MDRWDHLVALMLALVDEWTGKACWNAIRAASIVDSASATRGPLVSEIRRIPSPPTAKTPPLDVHS